MWIFTSLLTHSGIMTAFTCLSCIENYQHGGHLHIRRAISQAQRLFDEAMRAIKVMDGRDGLQIWNARTVISNEQSRTTDKGWSSSLEFGLGANNPHRKETMCVKTCYAEPWAVTDSLERPKQQKWTWDLELGMLENWSKRWVQLAQDRVHRQTLVNTVMILRVS
jgi:hypothetical protein